MWVCKNCTKNETVCYVATLIDANCEKCGTPTKAKDLNYINKGEKMENKPMTEEEAKKFSEERKKVWDDFMDNLKHDPMTPVNKSDLFKALEYISDDVGALAQMCMANNHNLAVLNHNLNQLVGAIQGGRGNNENKTKSGIIIP